ncbi:hypothetical protein A2866_05195 [Candidatus Roizmanbacteria bacterium RIFCSPHIGHO2_01_FULL_39_8]|uniref:Glycosyltransferase RgtA/B/C/D-like domain-containing protein n=1 Tax=Candidatus Roizmanbacteria bacterium RIFCSPHIGHO2_01_FULL_39_8 TaxID=1802033 RepID=A0A1F7GFF0_9BACT|nr:MAG: hypothetical protein A2866_05195 [Candidatus Roizmanbacteria bacterium RIFCSPHIGHO2_01_FULL_39_8]
MNTANISIFKRYPVLIQVGVFLLYVLIAIIATYPAIIHFTTAFIGDGGDNIEYVSYQYLVQKNLSEGKYPFAYSYVYRYPYGFNFGAASDARLISFVGGLLLPVLGDTATFNGLVLFFLALNGYCAFLLYKSLTSSYRLGILGGTIYGFAYFVLARGAGFVNLMQVFGFPLVGFSLLQILKETKNPASYVWLLCFSYLLLALSSLQYLLIGIGATFLLGVFFCILYPYETKNFLLNKIVSFKKTWALGAVVVTILFIGFFYHFVIELIRGGFSRELPGWPKDMLGYIVPSAFFPTVVQRIFALQTRVTIKPEIDGALFLGFIELVIFLLFVCTRFRHKQYLLFVIPTFSFWILALGTQTASGRLLPYYWLKYFYPFKVIAESERLVNIFYLFITGAVLSYLQPVLKRYYANVILLAVSILVLMERIGFSYYIVPANDFRSAPYEAVVAKTPGRSILDFPLVLDLTNFHGTEYNLLPFYYQKNIIEGYFHWIGDNTTSKRFVTSPEMKRYLCTWRSSSRETEKEQIDSVNALISILQELEIHTIVIHKKQFYRSECYNARKRISYLLQDMSQDEAQISPNDYLGQAVNSNRPGVPFKRIYIDNDAIIYSTTELNTSVV